MTATASRLLADDEGRPPAPTTCMIGAGRIVGTPAYRCGPTLPCLVPWMKARHSPGAKCRIGPLVFFFESRTACPPSPVAAVSTQFPWPLLWLLVRHRMPVVLSLFTCPTPLLPPR